MQRRALESRIGVSRIQCPQEPGGNIAVGGKAPPQRGAEPRTKSAGRDEKKTAFSKVLAGELATRSEGTGPSKKAAGVAFSAHAQSRLNERNITLSPDHLQRLDHGVQLADSKGSVNTLVLMDDTVFIVNVKNRKVITAIARDGTVDNVFTQIDSATIV